MLGSLSHQPPGPVKILTAIGWWWHKQHDTLEHIDPANLERDTAIVLRVLWRLLSSPVVPLDYTAFCASLDAELVKPASCRLDLGLLCQRVQDLRQAATVNQLALSVRGEQAQRLNHALMRASRLLVPLNYTAGNRFCHNRTLPHQAWPSLGGLRELTALPADSEEQPFYASHAHQNRNLAAHALRETHAALATGARRYRRCVSSLERPRLPRSVARV